MLKKIKKHKDLIFAGLIWLFAFLAFITVSLALIFSASGYAYNHNTREIEKTGMAYITTYPLSVSVYLNDKLVATRTPFRSPHLLPGEYQFELRKNGYQSVFLKVDIQEGLVTKMDRILMTYQDVKSKQLSDNKIIDFFKNDDDQFFTIYEKGGIFVGYGSISTNKITQNVKLDTTKNDFGIIGNLARDYLLLKDGSSQYWIVNLEDGTTTNLNQNTNITLINKIQYSSNKLWIQTNNKLYTYQPSNKTLTTISENVITYDLQDDCFVLERIDTKVNLVRFGQNNLNKSTIKEDIQISNLSLLHASIDGQFAATDTNGNLYILPSNKAIGKQVDNFLWTDNKGWLDFNEKLRLVYTTNNNIWLYQNNHKDISGNLSDNRLITKPTEDIKDIGFFYDENNIYFTTNNNIYISDTYGNTSILPISISNKKIAFSNDFRTLYLFGNQILNYSKIR